MIRDPAKRAEYNRKRREKRNKARELGMCTNHPKIPAAPGSKCCQECIDTGRKNAISVKNRRNQSFQNGMCPKHPQTPAIAGKIQCHRCIENSKTIYTRAIENNRCTRHPEIPAVRGTQCQACLDEGNEKRLFSREMGLCPNHTDPVICDPGYRSCRECLNKKSDNSKRSRIRAKENGVCVNHTNKKAEVGHWCFECWLKQICFKNLGNVTDAAELGEILNRQNRLCFYTGKLLIPGDNASVDHIIPKSRDGEAKLYNLKWVDYIINSVKREMLHEEFLEVAAIIAYRFNNNDHSSNDKLSIFQPTPISKLKLTTKICRVCNKFSAEINNCCARCWFKEKANDTVGSPLLGSALEQKLIKQNYRCAYTGVLLIPGKNASPDHIIPRSKDESLANNLNNIQWVDFAINLMKWNLTHEEFVDICKIITRKFANSDKIGQV